MMDINDFKEVMLALQPIVGEVTDSAIIIACIYIGFNLLISLTVPLVGIFAGYKTVIAIKQVLIAKKTTVIDQSHTAVLDGEVITSDAEVTKMIKRAFSLSHMHKGSYKSVYMHREHAEWLLNAAEEKLEREGE